MTGHSRSTPWTRRLAAPYFWSTAFGLDPLKLLRSLRGLAPTMRDYWSLRRGLRESGERWPVRMSAPCLDDRFDQAGQASGHYFHQDLYVAQAIFCAKPLRHVDVGSRIDGFVAHVATFMPIEVIDIRPLEAANHNIAFRQFDLLAGDESLDGCSPSVSCLHALEHFGLGRYGDPVEAGGYRRGFERLTRLVQPCGTLYLSVPIGPQRVEFNGHRVFAVQTILDLVAPSFDLKAFAFVDDAGELHTDVALQPTAVADSFSCYYGCGIFTLERR